MGRGARACGDQTACGRGVDTGSRRYLRGAASRRALRGLGINIDAPVAEYRLAYERFIPDAASDGVYRILAVQAPREAVVNADVELDWLADRLTVVAPTRDDVWWGELWKAAACRLPRGFAVPSVLGLRARRVLLARLMSDPRRVTLIAGLAEAMSIQSGEGLDTIPRA